MHRRFNPRARGGRDFLFCADNPLTPVSIHAPVGGATLYCIEPRQSGLFVSIHAPVGGATPSLPNGVKDPNVSIHAPVGGATFRKEFARLDKRVSIHAPVGGATTCL